MKATTGKQPFALTRNKLLTIIALAAFAVLAIIANSFFDAFTLRVFNMCAIYIVLALSLNLLNGFTGLFSLGHAGFMAVGAYVCALLTMTPELKEMNYFLVPIVPWLRNITIPFLPAILIAGLASAFVGFLIGAPVLRLRDDYLAIATLGFGEIIRVLITNAQPITNGAQGLKGLPRYATTFSVWVAAGLVTLFMVLLMRSSYGRAMKAVRDDELAAEAMGINVFRVKVTSFTVSSFLAGVGGALLGHMITTIDPKMFTFMLTFNILLIVVLGGIGSISGSVISAIVVTILMEALRFLDEPMNLIFFKTEGLPGLRMVVFSILLMVMVIYRQRGLMGNKEFSWDMLQGLFVKKGRKGGDHV
ncbi:ABC-type transporter, integral membrane subunit [uncultured spirochete]|jgi:branched-chain amino acid transport system permease protein|uniref:ABC-type transporter, integral membrane subunit n=1 Tax=uncultured spirochete TaxID=156406 RepID=A0A3P3XIJ8_9SPIR|nr:ABC-type transporter, integral membrane subunit [uncultured spirochete]HBE46153.1 branched-chain amino acid ABC transporter permease [Spirochaetaceae bacterium]HCX97113.1 branched-chain amino acid ABC transporter permease [Spirochaetaceae bacterium]